MSKLLKPEPGDHILSAGSGRVLVNVLGKLHLLFPSEAQSGSAEMGNYQPIAPAEHNFEELKKNCREVVIFPSWWTRVRKSSEESVFAVGGFVKVEPLEAHVTTTFAVSLPFEILLAGLQLVGTAVCGEFAGESASIYPTTTHEHGTAAFFEWVPTVEERDLGFTYTFTYFEGTIV